MHMHPDHEHQLQNGKTQLKKVETFRSTFAASMKEAAKQANVKLLTGDVSFAVRDDYVVANALLAPPQGVLFEVADRMFLVYLSFPANHPYAKKVPSGFYTIERMAEQKNPRAKVVDVDGKTVLEVPLNIRKIELSPPKYGTPPQPDIIMAQATIEQAAETLYQFTRVQAHGVRCHWSIGTWYWIWV
jgi:hypothetical protein